MSAERRREGLLTAQRRTFAARAVEAVIDEGGEVRLLEDVTLPGARRALVVILDEPAQFPDETALMSEAALAEDWERPEEDAAWAHLQPEAQLRGASRSEGKMGAAPVGMHG